MKKFSADWIYTLAGPPLKNGVITVNENGVVTDISEKKRKKTSYDETLHSYRGIIVPGFVNCHCHLELSHLKGQIREKLGISNFIGEINLRRNAPEEEKHQAALSADIEMFSQGIAAVGDISNSDQTVEIKKQSPVSYFTFVEVFGFHPSYAGKAFDLGLSVHKRFSDAFLPASVVPHSPYSVSDELFIKIKNLPWSQSNILSVHNQESEAENRFYHTGDGPISEHLIHHLGLDISHWKPTGKNSLESVLPKLPADKPLLLVHNTFSTEHDLAVLKILRRTDNTFIVLCPNSNLFISDQLPPVNIFRSGEFQICVGTDSLASNTSLSVLSALVTIQHNFRDIGLEELLTWACLNGARALNMTDHLGTIEVGKNPGIVLISGTDLVNHKLTPDSRAIRLA